MPVGSGRAAIVEYIFVCRRRNVTRPDLIMTLYQDLNGERQLQSQHQNSQQCAACQHAHVGSA
jgi:hypothetical protein